MSVQKKGNLWYIVLEERDLETGKRRQRWVPTGSSRKRDALEQETIIKAQQLRGVHVVPSADSLSRFLTDEWLPSIRTTIRPATYQSYEQIVRTQAIPRIGEAKLKTITPVMLNRMYRELLDRGRLDGRGGLSPKSVRNIHVVLHKALGDAVRWDKLARNPADLADPPKATRREIKVWAPEQLATFLHHVHEHRIYAAFRLMAMTGMRRGEVLGLRWSDVDLTADRLSIQQTRLSVNYQQVISEPKTAKGRRSVRLDHETASALKRHRKQQLEERMAAGETWEETESVFTDEFGHPIHPDRFTKLFVALVEAAGIERLTPHGLRHTYATLALQARANPKVVSDRLGHANVSTTLQIYSHVTPAVEQGLADTVARLVDEESR